MPNRPPTLKDISRIAGCHHTTVARALKGNTAIAEKTREHILKIAKEIGYRPDPLLQALVRYRRGIATNRNTPIIAFISHDNSEEFVKRGNANCMYLRGAREQADALGYSVKFFWHGDPTISDARWNQILLARGIQSIITASFPPDVRNLNLDWEQFSAVKISVAPTQPELDTVSCNQMQTIRTAFRKLRALGYRRIGFHDIPKEDDRLGNMWTAGFLAEQAKIPESDRIAPITFAQRPTPQTVREAVEYHRLDAILSYADPMYDLLLEAGFDLGKDLAYAHLNIVESEEKSSHLAGMKQSYFEVGKRAVNFVTRLHEGNMRGLPELASMQYVDSVWVDGPSVREKSPPGRSPARKRRKPRAAAALV